MYPRVVGSQTTASRYSGKAALIRSSASLTTLHKWKCICLVEPKLNVRASRPGESYPNSLAGLSLAAAFSSLRTMLLRRLEKLLARESFHGRTFLNAYPVPLFGCAPNPPSSTSP